MTPGGSRTRQFDQHRNNPVEHRKRNLRYEHEEARRSDSARSYGCRHETLRVGSETVYPPFEFLDSNSGKYVGFDIDLIDEVAKRAGFEPQILSMGLDGLIPALMSGSIDVAVFALTITLEERAAKVDFTKPCYESGLSIMARKDDASIKGVKDLENKVLCAEIGSSGSVFMSKIKGAKIRTFNSAGEAFLELNNKGREAIVNDKPVNE